MKDGNGSESLRLDVEGVQLLLGQLHRRYGERVLGHRVGRGQPLALAQRQLRDVVHERHDRVLDRQADVERVVVGLVGRRVEHGRRAAGALDERVAVVSRHRRRGRGQQRRERPEGQVHVVVVDQRLVVGDDLVRRALVIQDRQLHLAAHDAAMGVHVLGPQLVALLEGHTVGLEAAVEGERRADRDRPGVGRSARARARTAAAAAATARREGAHGQRDRAHGDGVPGGPGEVTSHRLAHFRGGYTGRFRGEPGAESSQSLTIRARSRGRPRELLPRAELSLLP